ncbi:hypothetical protein BJ170DRAFT_625017 [Xylariales sp. AK1849]|nr:hypothetical protein BJ170DRAFT_625017 [Xylariales sp. AK1849]
MASISSLPSELHYNVLVAISDSDDLLVLVRASPECYRIYHHYVIPQLRQRPLKEHYNEPLAILPIAIKILRLQRLRRQYTDKPKSGMELLVTSILHRNDNEKDDVPRGIWIHLMSLHEKLVSIHAPEPLKAHSQEEFYQYELYCLAHCFDDFQMKPLCWARGEVHTSFSYASLYYIMHRMRIQNILPEPREPVHYMARKRAYMALSSHGLLSYLEIWRMGPRERENHPVVREAYREGQGIRGDFLLHFNR